MQVKPEDYACEECGAIPDQAGTIQHTLNCHVISRFGGGASTSYEYQKAKAEAFSAGPEDVEIESDSFEQQLLATLQRSQQRAAGMSLAELPAGNKVSFDLRFGDDFGRLTLLQQTDVPAHDENGDRTGGNRLMLLTSLYDRQGDERDNGELCIEFMVDADGFCRLNTAGRLGLRGHQCMRPGNPQSDLSQSELQHQTTTSLQADVDCKRLTLYLELIGNKYLALISLIGDEIVLEAYVDDGKWRAADGSRLKNLW